MSVYDIEITKAEGAAPDDGFIDNHNSGYYINQGAKPTTVALAKAKSRAYLRYKMLIHKIEEMATCEVISVTAPDADEDTAPTTITIRVSFPTTYLITADEVNSGQFLSGAAAIERCVARALIYTETRLIEYFDPTASAAKGDNSANPAFARVGPRFETETIGPVAEDLTAANALITVSTV